MRASPQLWEDWLLERERKRRAPQRRREMSEPILTLNDETFDEEVILA